jgi:hypothetical protein
MCVSLFLTSHKMSTEMSHSRKSEVCVGEFMLKANYGMQSQMADCN